MVKKSIAYANMGIYVYDVFRGYLAEFGHEFLIDSWVVPPFAYWAVSFVDSGISTEEILNFLRSEALRWVEEYEIED